MAVETEEDRHKMLAALEVKTKGKRTGDREAEKIASEVPIETLRNLALSPSEQQRRRMQARGKPWEE